MNIAVISVTERGRSLSRQVKEQLHGHSVRRFCFYKHTDAYAEPFERISDLTSTIFGQYGALVYLCAAGIAVRSIAPHLVSKTSDPAVLVMDDSGHFVIPILSGHLGGANALARVLAEKCGAVAAVTTATDAGGLFSPDCYAADHALALADLGAAKAVAAAVLHGEPVGFVSRLSGYELPEGLTGTAGCRIGLCITENAQDRPFSVTLQLMPKNLVVGIGCKKGVSADVIACQVQHACETAGVWQERICACATIDIKAQEQGLLEFCRRNRLPLTAYTASELMALEGNFTTSAFAAQVTGADNVCERSAVLCSGGTLLVRKTSGNGVTAAIAVSESNRGDNQTGF